MIVGGRIDEIEGKRTGNNAEVKGLSNIEIGVDNVTVDGEKVEITYNYKASYGESGYVKMKGVLVATEDKKLAKDIKREWDEKKKLLQSYAEGIVNAISYSGSANGTLMARVLNFPAPLVPPRIQLQNKKE